MSTSTSGANAFFGVLELLAARVRKLPLLLSVFLSANAFALAVGSGNAQATMLVQYCASGTPVPPPAPPPGYSPGCFPSLDEAEAYLRTEPDPPTGRSLLQPKDTSPGISGTGWTRTYWVPPRPYQSFADDTWDAHWEPTNASPAICTTTFPFLPPTETHCANKEPELKEGILASYVVQNSVGCVEWFDSYVSQPEGWNGYTPYGGVAAWNNQGMVRGSLNGSGQPGWPAAEAYDCPDGPPPFYPDAHFVVGETGYWWCPAYFMGEGGPSTNIRWPVVCSNGSTGSITERVFQYDTPCVGDPCEPVSGALIENEFDFTWGSLRFSRTYNSLRQLPEIVALGPGWSHSLGMKMWVSADTNYAFVRGQKNEIEEYYQQNPGVFRSMNIPGSTLTKYASGGITTWILRNIAGEQQIFDGNGVLTGMNFPDHPADNLAFTYCDSASFDAGLCAALGYLTTAVDGRGRLLTFEYRPAAYTADSNPIYVPPRLTDVVSDSGVLVHYEYDAEGNLYTATYADQHSRTYLYGEASNICIDGSGNTIAGCSVAPFTKLLTGTLDEASNRFLNVTYGADARVTSTSRPGGAGKVSLAYTIIDGSMPIPQATLADGEVRTYIYNNQFFSRLGDYTVAANGSDYLTQHTYDADNRLYQETDPRGIVTQFGYDAYHEISRIEALGRPEQRTIQTDWDNDSNRISGRQVYNASSTLETQSKTAYNGRGQRSAYCTVDPAVAGASTYACGSANVAPAGVRQWIYAYCEQADVTAGICPIVGLLRSMNGPRLLSDAGMDGADDVTTYIYYPEDDLGCERFVGIQPQDIESCEHRRGDLWKVTNALGQITEIVKYDRDGRPIFVKDANGTYTKLAYHPRGWLTDRILLASAGGAPGPGDATTHFDYDLVGNVSKVTQPDGDYILYTYDDAHRVIKMTDNLGNTIDYCPGGIGSVECLDASGNRRVEQTKDSSHVIRRSLHRVYDQLGQLQKVLSASSQPKFDATDGYDGNHNLVQSDDGLDIATQRAYDGLNRLVTTLQNYGGADPATSNTDTDYAYDTRDHLRQVTDPDGLITSYAYDGLDNLTDLSSPDTGHTIYGYDKAGNRINKTDNRRIISTYTYDALNRLVAISYPTSTLNITYAYDQSNAVTGCATSYPIGRLTKMTDGSGITTYCYDRHGNVTVKKQVVNGLTFTMGYTYSAGDRLIGIAYPSGMRITYNRNAIGRISSVSYKIGSLSTSLVSSATYYPFGPLNVLAFSGGLALTKTYDQDYAIDTITSSISDGLTLDFGVDVMGNITSASQTIGPPSPDRAYGYDALYRLTTVQAGPTPLESYTYNKTGDRLSAALNGGAATAYTYTTGTHHLVAVGGATRSYDLNGNTLIGVAPSYTFGYDDKNRFASASGGFATSYAYTTNGRGERTLKVKTGAGPSSTTYVYDERGVLLGEYASSGAPQAEYIYLDATPIAVSKGGLLSYIETDHLGTPRQVVAAATGGILWGWDFLGSAFGTDTPNQNPAGAGTYNLNLRSPGQYFDSELGLSYNYFRDYESRTGRYIESDPIGLKGGINSYAYVAGSPLHFFDFNGLEQWIGCMNGGVAPYGSCEPYKAPPAKCSINLGVNLGFSGVQSGVVYSDYHGWGVDPYQPEHTRLPDFGIGITVCCKSDTPCESTLNPHPWFTWPDGSRVDEVSFGLRRMGFSVSTDELCISYGRGYGAPINTVQHYGTF